MTTSYQHQLNGELNLTTVADAFKQLNLLNISSSLVIDFVNVTKVDSSALVYIFAVRRLANKKNWQLQLINLPDEIHKLADIYDIHEIIN